MSIVPLSAPTSRVLSVSELNRYARDALEQNLPLSWVAGEISNLKRYDSGHCYFTLKDAQAQVDCVMFRHKLQFLSWRPENGMQVEVRACATLYEARGKFQLNVDSVRRAGLGALYEAYERLKAQLEKEGLFDAARKQTPPEFPRAVGVVTSLQAAALRDVLTTLKRRLPTLPVIVYPSPVQGEGAALNIAEMIRVAGARNECDVLIVCRGGGNIEDLWAYNEEVVARAIQGCPIPVITGIGHETDFTIADFVADVRAATPTAAAALAAPDRGELRQQIQYQHDRISRLLERCLEQRMQRLDYLSRRLQHPGERIHARLLHLNHLAARLRADWRRYHETATWQIRALAQRHNSSGPDLDALTRLGAGLARRLAEAARGGMKTAESRLRAVDAHLRHLNPRLVLERGYSITEAGAGRIIRDSATLSARANVKITFAQGWVEAQVTAKADGNQPLHDSEQVLTGDPEGTPIPPRK